MTTFGVELEIIPAAGQEAGFKPRVVRELQELGLSAIDASYSGRMYSLWQVKYDGSVHVRRNNRTYHGCEVVSPVLTMGDESMAQVRQVCGAIERAGGTVNIHCGLHCHVGIQDRNTDQVRNVVRAYGSYREQIDSVLPRSRRDGGRASRWAQPLWRDFTRALFIERLEQASTIRGIDDLIQGYNTRYSALSLAAYPRIGTIEFRQHSGTVDAEKVCNWARWCVAFVEKFSEINVLAENPQQAALHGHSALITSRVAGRGTPRFPRRRCESLTLIQHMLQGHTFSDEMVGRFTAEDCSATDWVKYIARQYGWSFTRFDNGHWAINESEARSVRPVEPFQACFGLGDGLLAYFGRRRSALA